MAHAGNVMKKTFALLLSIIVLITMIPVNVFATDELYTEDLTFERVINGDTGELCCYVNPYKGTSDEIVIPDKYLGYIVREIKPNAFEGTKIKSVKLPNQLKRIGGYAFCDCIKLESVEFPDSMETLYGSSAFSGCTSLKNIKFGSNLASISSQAFMDCTALEEIYFPESLTMIGSNAFKDCTNLKKVFGGNGLEKISSSAFYKCTSLESFVIGNKVESLGMNAFSSCYNLKSITFGSGLKTIENGALSYCTSLGQLFFKTGLETIESNAFRGCSSLVDIYLPKTVKTINSYAFYGCDSIQNIYYAGDIDDFRQIDIDDDHNDVLSNVNIHYNYICDHTNKTIIPSKNPTCSEIGFTEGKSCNTCGEILIEQSEIEMLEHKYYWHHTESMGENAYDLMCSNCDENFGRGYLNSDNQYCIYGYAENLDYYHYVYNENAECLGSEKCEIDHWYTDESYHEGVCKCHLVLREEESHDFAIEKYDSVGHWMECSQCKTVSETNQHSYDNACDNTCNGCGYTRTTNHTWSAATCIEPETCKTCGETQGNPLGHNYYWYHTDSMGENAYDLICSDCDKNFGRGYLNSDNQYHMYGYMKNESYYHYIYDEDAKCLGAEKCEVNCWYTDESYHEGVCKCHLVLYEEDLHKYTNKCDSTCNTCDYVRTISHTWTAATCLSPKTCTICGATTGTTGEHNYENVITPATTYKNGTSKQICSVCGNTGASKKIYEISSYKLNKTRYNYDGKQKTPKPIIKDSKGNVLVENKDYTLEYSTSERKDIGSYHVYVYFQGCYSGAITFNFQIGPKNPSSVKATLYGYDDVNVSWSKVSGADGYHIYYKKSTSKSWTNMKYTSKTSVKLKDLTDGVKYDIMVVSYKKDGKSTVEGEGKSTSIYTLKKITGVKTKKSSSKVKVSWTNIPGETGYQISQSTKKIGTNVVATYKTTSGKSKTISAKKGKAYYYKVRAYKIVNGKKIYAPWSSPVKYTRK